MKIKLHAMTFVLLALGFVCSFGASLSLAAELFGIGASGPSLYVIDPADFSVKSRFSYQLPGHIVQTGHALAAHPTTGELWAVIADETSSTNRKLVKIDPSTQLATLIGDLGDRFAGLAFNADGSVLWGVTGKGASSENEFSLFSIDQSSAVPTKLCTFSSINGGVALAFNSADGFLYYQWGSGLSLEKVTSTDGSFCGVQELTLDPEPSISYVGALTYLPGEQVFAFTQAIGNANAYKFAPSNGAATDMGVFRPFLKGLALSDKLAPSIPSCPPIGALYGTTFQMSELWRINPQNGLAVLVGDTGRILGFDGLAFHPDGTLYGLTHSMLDPSAGMLVRVNPCTAAIEDIGLTGLSWGEAQDLRFIGETAYLFNLTNYEVYTVNLSTGATTSVASPPPPPLPDPLPFDWMGFDFLSDGSSGFLADLANLFVINPTTGSLTLGPALVLPSTFQSLGLMSASVVRFSTYPAAVGSDTFIGLFYSNVRTALGYINRTTGEVTAIGQTAPEITSLAAFQDVDGDGVSDSRDGCPLDGSKSSSGVCGCGVADSDADGDGVLLCNDQCPLDKAKTQPLVCGCGNPETDKNGDFVVDCGQDPGKVGLDTILTNPPNVQVTGQGKKAKLVITMQQFSGIQQPSTQKLQLAPATNTLQAFKYIVSVVPQGKSKPAVQFQTNKNTATVSSKKLQAALKQAVSRILNVSYRVGFFKKKKNADGKTVLKSRGKTAASPAAQVTVP